MSCLYAALAHPTIRPLHPSNPRNALTACCLSFGDPNARPPTPQNTPTTVLSSPLLQTPKQNSSHFDEASGWTPRFAEEYSVFNSTPGNLRGASSASGAFSLDFAPTSPVPLSTGKKRPLSAEGVALEIATHANHFTADPAALAPVDPARRLSSSPDLLILSHKEDAAAAAATPSNLSPTASEAQQELEGQPSAKKPRRASVSGTAGKSPSSAQRQTQTATPPPSSRGGRKLAPKPKTDSMHNQAFQAPGFSGAPPPQLNTAFVTGNPEDVFGYPLGPATAPPITAPRPFWGFDMDTTAIDESGMAIDVDLSAAGTDLFQTPAQHVLERPMTSMEWGRANFQQTPSVARADQQQQQQLPQSQHHEQDAHHNQPSRRERPLAPKTANMSTPNISQSPNQDFSFGSFQMMDNPYNTSPGGVDPGLLFSQPPSSAPMDSSAISMSVSMDSITQYPASTAPANMARISANANIEPVVTTAHMPASKDLQRSGPQRQGQGQSQARKKLERVPAISPAKSLAGRPALSRSFSDSSRGGKRTVGGVRNSLPTLAPSRPATTQQRDLSPSAANQGNARPHAQGAPSSGRSSPLKLSQHHRLSSLTSIPEKVPNTSIQSRNYRTASVKFVIDENGRAHTETVVTDDEDEDLEPDLALLNSVQRGSSRNSWGVSLPAPVPGQDSDEEYSSSSDDEPIIIPSRNTSFNLPEPPKSSGSGKSRPPAASILFSQNRRGHRSLSERHVSSSSREHPLMNPDKADSVDMDMTQPQRPSTGSSLGDAAAELRKVMQACNPRQLPPALSSSGSSLHRQRFTSGQRSSSSTISESSLPSTSPIGGGEKSQIRCVCSRSEAGDGVFLIKWSVLFLSPLHLGTVKAGKLPCIYSFLHVNPTLL